MTSEMARRGSPSSALLTTLLRRIALGLPLASIVAVGGCSCESRGTGGCTVVGSREVSVTASAVRSLSDCRSLCPAGGTGPGSSSVSACSLVDVIPDAALPDAPAVALDAATFDEDAWMLDDSSVADGGLLLADGGAADPYAGVVVRIRCEYESCNYAGRLPSYASSAASRSADIGAWLADTASLEAAAIPAFAELRRELLAHGAPAPLIEAARRAQRDEVRHARTVGRLARAAGARPRGFRPVPIEPRDLESLATLNATEGCVREAHGALVAHAQGLHATDTVVRRVFARIARDEARHALLSLAVDEWVRPRLREPQRRRVQAAKEQAHASLVLGALEAPTVRDPLGLPNEETRHALAKLCV